MARHFGPIQREAWRLVTDAVEDVDAVFAEIAAAVLATVRRQERIDAAGRRAMLAEIDRLLDRVFGLTQARAPQSRLYRAIEGAMRLAHRAPYASAVRTVERAVMAHDPALWEHVRRELVARAAGTDPFARVYVDLTGGSPAAQAVRLQRLATFDPQRSWVPRERWTTRGGYRLSDRVWRHGRRVRREIDRAIVRSIRTGDSPYTLARELERYLDPRHNPTRYLRGGQTVRRRVPARPGGWASSGARKLARTEIMRVHGAAVVAASEIAPGAIGTRWNLSNAHADVDQCTEIAGRDVGLGRGVYTRRDLPRYPVHPNEMCVLSQAFAPTAEIVAEVVRRYGRPGDLAA